MQAATAPADPRWTSLLARDQAADGSFVYAVRTTGVFCRPSCPSRRPNPANVRFFPSVVEARQAGFRACKRCRPDQNMASHPHAARIEAACRAIETADDMPRLKALAEAAGLSPFHFHRVFRRATGLTPRGYAAAHRARRVQAGLSQAASVTEAMYEAGFNASSRFYAAAHGMLGMTPTAYRRGGAGTQIRFAIGDTTLGAILVAATARGVCAILLGNDPDALLRDLQDRFPRAELVGGDPSFDSTVATVVAAVEAPGPVHGLKLDLQGTMFQQRVWQALAQIPPGTTATYRDIAEKIGAPRAARAVAAACAANKLAVAIPCHRVVRTDGALAGYRWGIDRKRALLAREAE
jgi:AraC family transcriptional regulator of adaptative response/methylated-DNA-[protein]-cysteine methyltransferase